MGEPAIPACNGREEPPVLVAAATAELAAAVEFAVTAEAAAVIADVADGNVVVPDCALGTGFEPMFTFEAALAAAA